MGTRIIPPIAVGQTGQTPRVEIDPPSAESEGHLPLIDFVEPSEKDVTEPLQTLHLLSEGDDRAKAADDSATGSSDTARTG